jgi:predicted dehydrogenase
MTTNRRASDPQGQQPSRRQFGRVVAGTAAGLIAAPGHLRARGANERLDIAMIACGGRGAHNLGQMKGENIVALCDVYQPAVDRAAREYPDAIKCDDFRVLFDRHSSKFDAVVVSTPEHTHAFATLPALALGKHVYCEKPLTRDVHEARLVRLAADKAKVVTQMGNQMHSNDSFREVVELIRAGAIGPVTEAHVWVSRAWGLQSAEDAEKNKDIVSVRERPEGSSPVPPGLNWDLWVGPAPMRPYHDVYFPGPKWYRWWDFGNGTMSDLGSHWNDLPFWALDLKAPKTIEAFGPPPHPEIAPASMHVTYEYDARGDMPPVKMTWYQGVDKPEIWTSKGIPQWGNGMLFVGSEGMILADYGRYVLLPEDKFRDLEPPAKTIPRSPGHWAEWIANCKTGAACGSNFDYAGWLTEANHLGNVAYRVGKKITWDPATMTATNASEAEPFLRRAYRAGWTLG